MKLSKIEVEVNCIQPDWVINYRKSAYQDLKYQDSKYRIYLDNELLTERSWIWDNNYVIKENILVNLDVEPVHCLRLESLNYKPDQADYSLGNFNIDHKPVLILEHGKVEISFKMQ